MDGELAVDKGDEVMRPSSMSIKIEDEISRLAHLGNAAAAIVDYVRLMSKGSEFQRYTEWTLEPDNWIVLRFTYTRTFTVAITLGVPLENLPNATGIKTDRRWATQSRLYLKSARQLPVAFKCIEYAYYHSRNKHRKKHGFPERPKSA